MPATSDAFDSHLADWDAYLATPWARARYDVVASVLDETLARSGPMASSGFGRCWAKRCNPQVRHR